MSLKLLLLKLSEGEGLGFGEGFDPGSVTDLGSYVGTAVGLHLFLGLLF